MSTPEFEVKFHFGAKKIKKRNVFITALVLNLAVDIFTRILKLNPIQLWAIIDEIGRHFNIRLVNEVILQSPELLKSRIERDVDKAIENYKDMVEWEGTEFPDPTWYDEEDGETPLGGTLGFTYDFVEKDTNDEQN